jgi:hypothetical protein
MWYGLPYKYSVVAFALAFGVLVVAGALPHYFVLWTTARDMENFID